jgi:hypothetical protein
MAELKVISSDIAEEEVRKWLDWHDVDVADDASGKQVVATFVNLVCKGRIVINEDLSILQTLRFPFEIDGAPSIKEVKYASRISMDKVDERLAGVKSGDSKGRIYAHLSALSGCPIGMFRKLDSHDAKTAVAIFSVFFS